MVPTILRRGVSRESPRRLLKAARDSVGTALRRADLSSMAPLRAATTPQERSPNSRHLACQAMPPGRPAGWSGGQGAQREAFLPPQPRRIPSARDSRDGGNGNGGRVNGGEGGPGNAPLQSAGVRVDLYPPPLADVEHRLQEALGRG